MKRAFLLILFFILDVFDGGYMAQNNVVSEQVNTSFKYLLQAKINKKEPTKIYKELFSLQITDKRAFFAAESLAKRDSITKTSLKRIGEGGVIDFRGQNMPKTRYPYVIIQDNTIVSYYQNVGMSLFSYQQDVIKGWKILNETKKIETFICKKAEVYFGGRNWTAWYCPDIPLPYGPYKFGGLPGLIIQISDQKGEYDFKLVAAKSFGNMKASINLRSSRYTNSTITTQDKLEKAIDDFNENLANNPILANTTVNVDESFLKERREKYIEFKKNFNPIEISD